MTLLIILLCDLTPNVGKAFHSSQELSFINTKVIYGSLDVFRKLNCKVLQGLQKVSESLRAFHKVQENLSGV